MRVGFVLLPNRKPQAPTPVEQRRFWEAQWLGRLKSTRTAAENKEITGIPFDQPEIPYTALYLLGILRETSHADVGIIDLWEEGTCLVNTEKLRVLVDDFDIFLFSPFTSNYTFAKECVKAIKAVKQDSICIAGGHHASFCAEECLTDGFNVVLTGKGEKTLIELACSGWSSSSAIVDEMDATAEELDLWKQIIPAYDLLPERYKETYYARLFTTHGCPFRCIFCSNTVWRKRPPLLMPIQRIQQELSQIKSNISFKEIYVNDENFTLRDQHFRSVAELLAQEGLNWGCETRIDTVNRSKLQFLAKCNCLEIDYGLESLNHEILKSVNKGICEADAYRTFSETTEQGIRCHVNLMIGLPGETATTAMQTVETVGKWLQKGIISTVDYFVTVPYPGTELYNQKDRFGLDLKTRNWDHYREDALPVFDLPTMTSHEIYSCWLKGLNHFSEVIESIWS